jgi:hypothetical protein
MIVALKLFVFALLGVWERLADFLYGYAYARLCAPTCR